MIESSERYIQKCVEIGILTVEAIRKYPLRNANLAMVLKAYAIETNVPYTIDNNFDVLEDHTLYITDGGMEWLLSVFKKHSLAYLRSAFQFVFSNATENDIDNKDYVGYNNFNGITGDRPKAGTKQKAILICNKKEYRFDTLREAREAIFTLSRFYPVDEMELYRIRMQTTKTKIIHYKELVPTVLPESKRGVNSNLPHIRR